MDQELLAIILKDTYSLSQLKHRLRILKANLLKAFFGGGSTSTPGESEPTPGVYLTPQDLNWLKSLPENFYQKFTKDNVYKIFSDLEDEALRLNILSVFLAFEPDEPALSQIGSYARKTFPFPGLLLDIRLDPALIAGPAFSWKGVYKDYSLRAQMSAKKDELWAEFRKFLR